MILDYLLALGEQSYSELMQRNYSQSTGDTSIQHIIDNYQPGNNEQRNVDFISIDISVIHSGF